MSVVPKNNVTGLILAGGLGRRMGGVDKGLQPLNGKPMVACVLERLEPQVDALLINANQNQDVYRDFGHSVIADRIGGFAGPLAGLHAGLTVCTTPLLLTVPCDAPFLPRDLVVRLHDGLLQQRGAALAVVRSGGRLQPVFALVRRETLQNLSAFLAGGGRKVEAWFAGLIVATVDFADAHAFANINTRDELDALARSALP